MSIRNFLVDNFIDLKDLYKLYARFKKDCNNTGMRLIFLLFFTKRLKFTFMCLTNKKYAAPPSNVMENSKR